MNHSTINPSAIPVGIVGIGLMGSSIVTCMLMAGHPVTAIAPLPVDLTTALPRITEQLQKAYQEGLLTKQPEEYLSALTITQDYGFIGIKWAYGLVVIFIVLSLICVATIAAKPLVLSPIKESLKTRLTEGISFVFKNQVIVGALSLDLFAVFFGGAVALLPIFAKEVLNIGPQGLGLLRAAPSLGSVLMGVMLAHRPPLRNTGKKLFIFVAGYGVCMILFALSANFYLSLFILAVSGALDNLSVVTRATILQLLTPDQMRGRVSAVNSIFVGSSNEIGMFESGVAARLLGLVPSVIFGGTMTILVTGIMAWVTPKLRQLHLKSIM